MAVNVGELAEAVTQALSSGYASEGLAASARPHLPTAESLRSVENTRRAEWCQGWTEASWRSARAYCAPGIQLQPVDQLATALCLLLDVCARLQPRVLAAFAAQHRLLLTMPAWIVMARLTLAFPAWYVRRCEPLLMGVTLAYVARSGLFQIPLLAKHLGAAQLEDPFWIARVASIKALLMVALFSCICVCLGLAAQMVLGVALPMALLYGLERRSRRVFLSSGAARASIAA
ncbi:hypothetical protein WJX81_000666 [Elliptochloris bilobata]|uniref:Uncharacterized protein n=1 Tax=Elliptochloris bilobata TaxID=381761 RepID=A0AAW1S2E2_9CHLO